MMAWRPPHCTTIFAGSLHAPSWPPGPTVAMHTQTIVARVRPQMLILLPVPL